MTSLLAISDVHIGCPRLDPVLLHRRFEKFLYPHIENGVSILFICGDFFDSLLNMNSLASLESLKIITELKELCRGAGCDLRVLRGTFTHDRNQPQHFINGEDPDDSSVKLFDKLSFEYHDKTGLGILYVPDNLSSTDIYADIRALLNANGTDKADIMISHGYFSHLLPPNVPLPHGCLEVDKIQSYVRGCVLNGHVHLTSIRQNVISVGSFDRMAHGEEGPKGFYKIDIDDNKVCSFQFIENKDANLFITYDLRPFPKEKALEEFDSRFRKDCQKWESGYVVRIRIATDEQEIVESCSQLARALFPTVIVDKSVTSKRTQIIENVNLGLSELPVITPDNLVELLLPIIHKKYPNVTSDEVSSILRGM